MIVKIVILLLKRGGLIECKIPTVDPQIAREDNARKTNEEMKIFASLLDHSPSLPVHHRCPLCMYGTRESRGQ